jgi:hypothetical protein
MNVVALERTVLLLGSGILMRAWFSWRVQHRKRKDFEARLVDGAVLEAAFAPQKGMNDDPDLLAEMRDTFAHLNRRAYAEEFWGITDQLVTLYERLDEPQRNTMERVVVRLISTSDRWLQLIGARTSVRLGLITAIEPIAALLKTHTDVVSPADESATDARWREELEEAVKSFSNVDE